MLELLKRLIFGDCEPKPTLATVTTPDQLIAARIIQLITLHFDEWKLDTSFEPSTFPEHEDVFMFHYTNRHLYRENLHLFYAVRQANKGGYFSLNGVRFDNDQGNEILSAYHKIRGERAHLKRIADEAKAKMEADEAKWNLAENLLGLERTSAGALQPKGGYSSYE